MSFGWSAGDIAAAIQLFIKVAQVLDEVDGAANEYRQTVGFLRLLVRSLQPLQAWASTNPSHSGHQELLLQISMIREPVDEFLSLCKQFIHSLGDDTTNKSRYRHVGRKLQWWLKFADKAKLLQERIERQLNAMNPLIHSLMIEMMTTSQEACSARLPEIIGKAIDTALESRLKMLPAVSHFDDSNQALPLAHLRPDLVQQTEDCISSWANSESGNLSTAATQTIITPEGDMTRHTEQVLEACRLAFPHASPAIASVLSREVRHALERTHQAIQASPSRNPGEKGRSGKRRLERGTSVSRTISTLFGVLRCSTTKYSVQENTESEDVVPHGILESTIDFVPSWWLVKFRLGTALSTKITASAEDSLNIVFKTFNASTIQAVPDDSLIFRFAADGNIAGMKILLGDGQASVRDVDSIGRTPLHYAARAWQADACHFLLAARADMSKQALNLWEYTPFKYAACPDLDDDVSDNTQQIRTLQTFLEAKIDIEEAVEQQDFLVAGFYEGRLRALNVPFQSPSLWIFKQFLYAVQHTSYLYSPEWYADHLYEAICVDPGSQVVEEIIRYCDTRTVRETMLLWMSVLDFPQRTPSRRLSMSRGLKLLMDHSGGLIFLGSLKTYDKTVAQTTPTATAMSRSRSFRRFRTMLIELGIDIKEHVRQEVQLYPDGWTEITLGRLFQDDYEPNYEGYDWAVCEKHPSDGRTVSFQSWATDDSEPLWEQRKNRIKNEITGPFSEAELQVQQEWDESVKKYVHERICFECQRRIKAALELDDKPEFSPFLIHAG